ncbi:MAG TPA: glycosyltransferase family 4 protein [Acidimicrobiales bacterium]|nr:glycosyltransferase family 4 protein [Acidimicrobiales bacterium]
MIADVDHVLMLTNAVSPDKLGGLERNVRELSSALARKGMSVTVLTKQVREEDSPIEVGTDGVRIVRHRVPNKSNPAFAVLYPFYVAAGVFGELRRLAPRTVIHGQYPITSLPVALTNRPYVYTFHAPVHKEMLLERSDSYTLPTVIQSGAVASLRKAERRVVKSARSTVVLSEFMRAELGQLSATSAGTSQLIPGGIDTRFFSPGLRLRDAWATSADPLIFSARRLTTRTGVLELVRAFPSVLARHRSARLAVAGDGHERDAVSNEIRRLGLTTEVRLLGRISNDDLLQWYRNADLTVTPTQLLEGFGLSTGESLAVGTPALVTPVGANAELVRDLHPLLVAPGPHPSELAEGICRLLDPPELLVRLRTNARSHAHPRWSWDHVSDRYLDLYRDHA